VGVRVTIDMDSKNLLELLKCYYNLAHMAQAFGSDVEAYETRRGYHIIAYGLPISQEEALYLREVYGDDQARIDIDARQVEKPKQILWTHKRMKASRQRLYIPSPLN
jgi:hypothetical protein